MEADITTGAGASEHDRVEQLTPADPSEEQESAPEGAPEGLVDEADWLEQQIEVPLEEEPDGAADDDL